MSQLGLRVDEQDEEPGPAPGSVAAQIITSATIGYLCVYLLRYPITVLTDIRAKKFGTIFGVEFLVADSMSVAFLLGFGLAKLPATLVMTSPIFFNNRFRMIALLNLLTGLLIALPCALTDGDPYWTTLGLFLGTFPSSWVYGGLVSYYEGRTATDLILAGTTAGYITSGGTSRSVAHSLLDHGIEERWVPLLIFLVVIVPMTICFYFTDTAPKANAHDAKHRKKRNAMSRDKMWDFAWEMKVPLAMLLIAYAVLTAMRQFRDLFADSVFRASNGGELPSPAFFLMADALGALVAFVSLMILNTVTDSYTSLSIVFLLMCLMLISSLGTTWLFTNGMIDGLVWQVTVGAGNFGALTIMVPVWDRMVAVSSMTGTCTFVVFIADMCGYIVSIVMVFWKRFAAGDGDSLEAVLSQFLHVFVGGSMLTIVLTVFSAVYFWRRRQSREDNDQTDRTSESVSSSGEADSSTESQSSRG